MNTSSGRVRRLIEYVKGIKDNEDSATLFLEYKEDIENVKPPETFEIFYSLIEEGTEPKEILIFLDKVINGFYKSLSSYQWEKPKNDHFLQDLILENDALVEKTNKMKKILLSKETLKDKKEKLLPKVKELHEIKHHYSKKENILFPYLEKNQEKFQGLSIMWALHDKVKERIEKTVDIIQDDKSQEDKVSQQIGKLFFAILGVKKKEDLILFPTASEVLSDKEWYEMHKQSLEYEYSFIDKKASIEEYKDYSEELIHNLGHGSKFKTETGELTFEQILLIFNSLPVDLTFVDENNKVKYFTKPKDRIFPRSPAIIGREVKNCHPPDSVHIVDEIVENFRSNKKDEAKFWINLKGRMLFIQYYALRNSKGEYKGTLEVSQDVTEIRELKGQKRLLDWEK